MAARIPVSVIIMTYNEEKNLPHALRSVADWADEVFIVDSFSTDRTLEIARQHTDKDKIVQHPFEGFGRQLNWALDTMPIRNDWVYVLDADEQITPGLRDEIAAAVSDPSREEAAYWVTWKVMFMGKWIKYSSCYPTWFVRLIRKDKARREEHSVNPHMIVQGKIGYLRQPMIHENHKGISDWVAKHNVYATGEAEEYFKHNVGRYIPLRFWRGSQAERKRFIRYKIYPCLPARSFLYFLYLYVYRRGFLDGIAGFHFSVLKAFFFYLIELKIKEKSQEKQKASSS
ncbi:MAG: glycosyltransferase family 2 protein [Acidobacteriota bacterium]|nr:MAG: glycosyltransferase family 2 protein [Acidobacteriota bacterium]